MNNRFWRLDARPVGNAFAEALSLQTVPLAAPEAGQIVIRNRYLSMDAGTRMWMTAVKVREAGNRAGGDIDMQALFELADDLHPAVGLQHLLATELHGVLSVALHGRGPPKRTFSQHVVMR